MRVLGIDLAWGTVNETGVVALDPDGTIADAGWTTGVEDTAAWMNRWANADTLAFIDAPLAVRTTAGSARVSAKSVSAMADGRSLPTQRTLRVHAWLESSSQRR